MACRYTYQGKTYEAHEFDDLLRAMPAVEAAKYMPGVESVPSAPFVDSTDKWVTLALKRVLRMAAEEGYDRVAFITGQQAADLYSLSHAVDSIEWLSRPTGARFVTVSLKNGGPATMVVNESGKIVSVRGNLTQLEGKPLDEAVGKDVAKHIMETKEGELVGEGFNIGGLGMRAFYDKIVPAAANKLLAKVGGGKVEAADLGMTGDKSPYSMGAFRAEDARIIERAPGVFQVWARNERGVEQLRGGNHDSRAAAEAYIASMRPGQTQPAITITPAMRAAVMRGLSLFTARLPAARSQVLRPLRTYSRAGTPGEAMEIARRFLGDAAPAVSFQRVSEPDKAHVPMRFRLGTRTVEWNAAANHEHLGADVQGMIEELLHAIDATSGTHAISASMTRMAPGGDLRTELEAAYSASAAMQDFLHYPLKDETLSESVKAAELWAGAGVLYHVDPQTLRAVAPETFNAFDRAFAGPGRAEQARQRVDDGVPGEVRRAGVGLARAQDDGAGRPGARADGRGAGSRGARNADRLADLRARIAQEFGGSVDGGRVDFQRLPAALDTRRTPPGEPTREDPDLGFTDELRREADRRNWQRETVAPQAPDFSGAEARRSDFYAHLRQRLEGGTTPLVRAGRTDWREFGRRMQDFMRSRQRFNWWDKTVGTDYAKAQKNPEYAAVFYGAQEYVDDVSRFATEPADLAPLILPKMHSLRDVGAVAKSGVSRKHKADIAAASRAWLEGTLEDRVWTLAELRRMGLTERQVAMYDQLRLATNASLDALATSELYRIAKTVDRPLPDVRGLSPERARQLISGYLDESRVAAQEDGDDATIAKIDAAYKAMDTVQAKTARLKKEGYAPLMRFGRYAVSFQLEGEDGFLLFESEQEQNRAERELRAAGATDVRASILSQERYRLLRGMDPNALQLFAETAEVVNERGEPMALRDNPLFQEYLRQAVANRSAMKRLIKRGKVYGYSEDGRRVLAQFLVSNARLAAANHHMLDLLQSAQRIRDGDVQDEAIRLLDFVREPSEERWSARARSLMFIHFLGGNIASALVNMTQPLTMTLPYLGQFGNARAAAELAKGFRDMGRRQSGPLGAAMERATNDGILEPHEIHMLYAEADQALAASPTVRAALFAWGSLFSAAEAVNRKSTFIAAYRIGNAMTPAELRKAGATSVYDFAVRAVHETQNIYNRANRPRWARNPFGAVLMTFKQYSIHYIEFFNRLPRGQKLAALAVLLLLSGLQGLPFADDLDDLIDTLGQRLGYDTSAKQWKEDVLTEALTPLAAMFGLDGEKAGRSAAHLAMYGITSLPGMPLDVQGRLSMGNLIPGTAMFKPSNPNPERSVMEVLGPAGSFGAGMIEGGANLLSGDPAKAAQTAAPVAVQNVLKGIDMLHTGMYRDRDGRRVVDTTTTDALVKMTGFQPRDVAAESRVVRTEMESAKLQRVVESRLAARIAEAVFLEREDELEVAMAELEQWNDRNPETPVQITPQQIRQRVERMSMSRADRVLKTTPKEVRGRMADALTE